MDFFTQAVGRIGLAFRIFSQPSQETSHDVDGHQ